MTTAQLVLDYIRAFLTAPVLATVVMLTFFGIFKADIKDLIRRLATIRLPGGGEISTSQADRIKEEVPVARAQPQVPRDTPSIPEGVTITKEQADEFRQLFEAERAKAYVWEYRYLNHFLVLSTQRVLDWFSSLPQKTTVSLFDTIWQPIIPSAQERKAIVDALEQHHLIELKGDLIEVTPKGHEYIQWRGPLPQSQT